MMTEIKLTQELESGDVIEIANGSVRRVRFIRWFQGDLYAVTYLDLATDVEIFTYEYVNSKFTVQVGA
jgi:hypothetical protein